MKNKIEKLHKFWKQQHYSLLLLLLSCYVFLSKFTVQIIIPWKFCQEPLLFISYSVFLLVVAPYF